MGDGKKICVFFVIRWVMKIGWWINGERHCFFLFQFRTISVTFPLYFSCMQSFKIGIAVGCNFGPSQDQEQAEQALMVIFYWAILSKLTSFIIPQSLSPIYYRLQDPCISCSYKWAGFNRWVRLFMLLLLLLEIAQSTKNLLTTYKCATYNF